MVSKLPRRPKKKFPTKDALEFVANLGKESAVNERKANKSKKKPDSLVVTRGLKPLTWETTTEEGRFVGSGDATKRLGIEGVKAMLKSLPLSTASAGKFQPEQSSAESKVTQVKKSNKRKASGKGRRSTKVPKPVPVAGSASNKKPLKLTKTR